MYPSINKYCQNLESTFDLISLERKKKLERLSQYLYEKFNENKVSNVVVICTHNSRRSHIGQIFINLAVDYYNLPQINSYSGGTEATNFNKRAVNAMSRVGFAIVPENEQLDNPIYNVKWKDTMKPLLIFSKKYNSTPNPISEFAAILVCTEADAFCPLILGCDFRLPLPFDDPKAFDDTNLERIKYDERCVEIGREIFYALSKVY